MRKTEISERLDLVVSIQRRILEHSSITDEKLAEEIARRWVSGQMLS